MTGVNDIIGTQYLGIGPDMIKQLASSDSNIKLDSYDRKAYTDLLKASKELQNLRDAKEGESKVWPALLRDVWGMFFKAAPELLLEERVGSPYRSNRPYLEKIQEDPTTEQARLTTALDELSAGLATLETGKKLFMEIKDRPELKDTMEKAEKAEQQNEKGNGPVAEGYSDLAKQALQQAAREMRRAVRQAVQAGKEKSEQFAEALAGWGLEPGDLTRVPIDERLKLAERLMNHRMKLLSDLVGRFRNLARARQKHKVNRGRDEIHGISLGNDIGRILPAELATLNDPVRKLDFYRRYSERQLLQYELKSKEKLGRGPMVVLVDISGSMSGSPLNWAIATALALADTATRQKRQALITFFDTVIKKVVEFAPGEKNIEKIIEIGTVGAAGGTDYKPALTLAVNKIREMKYSRADVVMVTDGICHMDETFVADLLEAKKEMDFRIWSILIGNDSSGELKRYSDEVWASNRLTEDVAGEVFEKAY